MNWRKTLNAVGVGLAILASLFLCIMMGPGDSGEPMIPTEQVFVETDYESWVIDDGSTNP